MLSREGNRGLDPRGSLSPSPKFGDRAGMGKAFSKNSGTVRGGDYLKTSGRGNRCPRKSPNFGDGDLGNFYNEYGDGVGMKRA